MRSKCLKNSMKTQGSPFHWHYASPVLFLITVRLANILPSMSRARIRALAVAKMFAGLPNPSRTRSASPSPRSSQPPSRHNSMTHVNNDRPTDPRRRPAPTPTDSALPRKSRPPFSLPGWGAEAAVASSSKTVGLTRRPSQGASDPKTGDLNRRLSQGPSDPKTDDLNRRLSQGRSLDPRIRGPPSLREVTSRRANPNWKPPAPGSVPTPRAPRRAASFFMSLSTNINTGRGSGYKDNRGSQAARIARQMLEDLNKIDRTHAEMKAEIEAKRQVRRMR